MFIAIEGPPGSGTDSILKYLLNLNFTKVTASDTLLDFVTSNWRQNFVIDNAHELPSLNTFMKRPFFMLITVDAKISIKYKRYGGKFEKFIELTDSYEYFDLQHISHLHIINNSTSDSLKGQLDALEITNPHRLRPDWPDYFMKMADLAAHRSNCMKRRVGCVIVTHDNRVIATGYNGTPRNFTNCNEGGCARCNNPSTSNSLSTCLCLHAEENALLEAGRARIESGSILYCNTCPCLTCSIKIVQSGIKKVVYSQSYSMDDESKRVLKEADVLLEQWTPLQSEHIVLN